MNNLFKQTSLNNNRGFTLIELMLAMTLFISVVVVATTGFIGMNRTFSKGLVRKDLSESVQRLDEDVARSIRSGTEFKDRVVQPTPDQGVKAKCNDTVCYVYGVDHSLYRTSTIDPKFGEGTELLDKRYTIDLLDIRKIGQDLYRVKGIARTQQKAAFEFPSEGYPDENSDVTCKGGEDDANRRCSLEKFNFVVYAKGTN